jgi:flagellar assembly factor FliW
VTTTASLPTQEALDVSGDIPVLELVQPMVGFSGLRRFALVRIVEDGTICDLRSLEDPDVRFVVVRAGDFFAEYAPEIEDEIVDALGVEEAADVLPLVVVTLGSQPTDATANLRAPVLVNHRNRRAMQVILDDAELPLKAPLADRQNPADEDAQH